MNRNDFALGIVTWEWLKILFWFTFVPYYLWIQIASQASPWAWHVHGDNICCWLNPYGLPWYAFFRFATSFGWPMFGLILTVFDGLVLWLIARTYHPAYALMFFVSSMWIFTYDPIDLPVFWLGALAVKNPLFSLAGVLVKLPIGAPAYVWAYVHDVSLGQLWATNLPRYSLIGFWILGSLVYWGIRRFGKSKENNL